MFDVKQMINQYLGGQADNGARDGGSGNLNGIAGGALAGGLMGLLTGTKTGRKIGKNALVYGGTAVLGGLAYKAWSDWQSGKPASDAVTRQAGTTDPLPQPPTNSAFLPKPGEEAAFDRVLVRAMIGGAKADGQIDEVEKRRIAAQLEALPMDGDMKAFIAAEMERPLNLDEIVAGATCTETAAEIYAASLMAVDRSAPAEQGYLAMLAARLKLDPGLVEHLHANTPGPV